MLALIQLFVFYFFDIQNSFVFYLVSLEMTQSLFTLMLYLFPGKVFQFVCFLFFWIVHIILYLFYKNHFNNSSNNLFLYVDSCTVLYTNYYKGYWWWVLNLCTVYSCHLRLSPCFLLFIHYYCKWLLIICKLDCLFIITC
jgi:hypothetical protein